MVQSLGKSHPDTLSKPSFHCAEGIRGLACLIVLLTHAITLFFPYTIPLLAGSGKIGVWLFFVLSAFLLTSKLRFSGFSFTSVLSYFIGRFLRIIPLFLFAVLIYKGLGTTEILSWHDVKSALFFKKGFAHLWTIPVECSFYLYLPLIAYLFLLPAMVTHFKYSLGLFVLLILIEQYFWPYWIPEINSIEVKYYLTPFTTGIFFSANYAYLKRFISYKRSTVIGIATFFACILFLPVTKKVLFKMPLNLDLANQFVYFGFIWSFFVLATIEGQGYFGKLLARPVFKTIGKWSYSIYLFHWLVYMKFSAWWPNNGFAMLAGFFTAILLGGVVYALLERKLEALRKTILHWTTRLPISHTIFSFRV